MIPTWFLNDSGQRIVRERAAELRTYLAMRRAMRAASARWGL